MSGKVHYEPILATKVLMPGGWGGGGIGCPGKCTIQVMSQGMSTFLAYQREVCNRYSNCLLVIFAFRKNQAERCIKTAAKIISPAIENTFAAGYDW